MTSTPGWVNVLAGGVPGAIFAQDFIKGLSWSAGNPSGGLVVTSTTTQYVIFADGHVEAAAPGNLPRSDLGLAVWEASSNLVTATNDLTNGAWTMVNMTATLDQVGPDLVLNSASSLTSTAPLGTCLQTITHASASEQASVFVKAINVTGAINMTVDGVTWTAVTVGARWTQVSVPKQTLSNPIVGFQFANSGDSVAVWCAQVEAGLTGSGPTAPMPSGALTRGIPSITAPFGGSVGQNSPGTVLVSTGPLGIATGAPIGINGFQYYLRDQTGITTMFHASGSNAIATLGAGTVTGSAVERAAAFDGNSSSYCANGGAVATAANGAKLIGNMYFGTAFDTWPINGYLKSAVVWPSRLSDATLQMLSTP